MEKKVRFKLFWLLLVSFSSCKEKSNSTYEYASLKIDTARIAIFNHDTSLYVFPEYSRPLALSDEDLRIVDSLIILAVQDFNQNKSVMLYEAFNKVAPKDSFVINQKEYRRQYFPYKDSNGQKVFQVICLSRPFPNWKKKIYLGRLHYGISKFSIRINLSEFRFDEFTTASYG